MNKRKLERYLENCASLTDGYLRQVQTPLLLTDIKGDYLSEHSTNRIENSIVWLGGKGWTSERGLDYFTSNCDSLRATNGDFHLFVWLGTCDMTSKSRRTRYVHLNSNYSRDAAKLILNLKKFSTLASRKNFPVTILEIPVYCIREYNKYQGHSEPEIFAEQDRKLHLSIELVNKEIRKINRRNVKISPKFNSDLEFTRKNNSKYNKYRFCFAQFKDGVHPNPLLAKYWLRKISEKVDLQCFTHRQVRLRDRDQD